MLRFSALMALAMFSATAQALPDITAIACNACNDSQFEQKALSGGVGQRYYYDFAGNVLRRYVVAHEATDGHGAVWSVQWYAPDPAYKSYFDKSTSFRLHYGSFANTIILDLPSTSSAGGHTIDSVYAMFGSPSTLRDFGSWLGSYLGSVPIDPKTTDLTNLIQTHPGISFTVDPKRSSVKVKFKDGEAYFDLEDAQDTYAYRDGSAWDSENHRIPMNKNEFTTFYGGTGGGQFVYNSNAYNEFMRLAQAYGVPITAGGWHCGTVTSGGNSRVTCVFGS